jgi:iron complex outermembrane recepter protein
MRSNIRSQTLFAATALATVMTTPVFAQAEDGMATGDIIVTARRVEERLQDVPISITVFNQEQIDNRNITTATELATYTPSLASNNRFGADKASFSIRGFSMLETTAPTVGVYFGDVVALRATAGTASGNGAGPGNFFDLQNVQVLKGPQGTLFGRNTTGGAIILVPRKPTDSLEGYVECSVGNYDLRRVQAVLNVPLADTFKVRLGLDRQKRDGYLNNKSGIGPDDFADSNYVAARLSIVADLTPDLENYVVARYSRSDTNGFMFRLADCNRGTNPAEPVTGRAAAYARFACAQVDRQNARGDGFYDVENIVPDPFNIQSEWQIGNTTTWRVSDSLTVKNIISYGEFREQFHQNIGGENLVVIPGKPFASTIVRNLPGRYAAAQSTFTEELQLQGTSIEGKLNWQLGGYFEESDPISGGNTTFSEGALFCTDVTQLQCENAFPGATGLALGSLGLVQNQIEIRNIGFYAQGTFEFTPQLSMTAGIRYTIDRTIGQGGRVTVRYPTPNNPVGTCADPAKASVGTTLNPMDCFSAPFVQKSSEPTWVLDLEYKPIPDLMVYAKWARGYRQGGVNPSNIGLELWEPEKIDTYEVGAKASFRGAVSGYFNIAGFYNDLSNQQLQAIAIGCSVATCGYDGGIAGARIIVNAGKSRVYGVEVESSITPVEGLKLDVGYAYLNTKLQSFVPPVLVPGGPFANIVPAVAGGPLPLAPDHRVTATATYTLPLDESIGDISIGATYTYTSEQLANDTIPERFGILPSSNLVNLNLDWRSVAGSTFDIAAFVTNLTKEEFPVNAAGNYVSNGYESLVTNVPRMYGVRLKYRFGN